MPAPSPLTRRILAQNSGRDAARLELKLKLLRADAFAFFRGTNPLFLDFLPRRHGLFRAPATLVCGDLHLENYGAYKGDNRLCYFDLNDFDEACVAPFTIDIVRFLAAIDVAAKGLELTRREARRLGAAFLAAYGAAILDGKPRWIERSLASGVLRKLLRRAMRRTRRELLDRYSKPKRGVRRLRIAAGRAHELDTGELGRLRRFLGGFARESAHRSAHGSALAAARGTDDPRFYRLLDAARRIAGNGSLGLARYLLLVRGRGTPDGNFVLDLKFATPSAVAAWLGRRQPRWPDEAARIVAIQRTLQAISPALLRAVQVDGRPFVLKELQPSIDRLQFAQWRGKPQRIIEAVEAMGRVAAWAHLRACGRHGAASAAALQAYVAQDSWRRAAQQVAARAAARCRDAWLAYARDYDAGLVAAAVSRLTKA